MLTCAFMEGFGEYSKQGTTDPSVIHHDGAQGWQPARPAAPHSQAEACATILPHPTARNVGTPVGEKWVRLSRGIEAGVVGGMVALGFLVFASILARQGWWQIPNLLGSTFYGNRAFRAGASMATLSGMALQFVISGSIGAAFAFICGRVKRRSRIFLLGVVTGLVWHYLAEALFWPHVNPRVPAYTSEPLILFGNVLFGFCLGGMLANRDLRGPSGATMPVTPAIVPRSEEVFESPQLRQD
jgi:hypothetical protein